MIVSLKGCGNFPRASWEGSSWSTAVSTDVLTALKLLLRANPCWLRGPRTPNCGKHTGMPPLQFALMLGRTLVDAEL